MAGSLVGGIAVGKGAVIQDGSDNGMPGGMIPKSGFRFSDKIMLKQNAHYCGQRMGQSALGAFDHGE
jgi:hypothetical protein